MYRPSITSLSAALLIAISFSPVDAAWVVTEVPQQGGWTGDTSVYDINDSGIACGTGNYVSGSSSVAFRFDGTTVTELPYLHPSPTTYPFAWPSAINSSGLIAGRSHDANGVDRAVIWDGAAITLIPFPADANSNSDMRAYGINDAGVAVGYYSSTTTGKPAAFYYDGTTHSLVSALQAVGLGMAGDQSYADDANNHGVICGEAKDSSGEYNFYTYDIGTGIVTDQGRAFDFDGSHAAAINDAGLVIGRGRSGFGTPIHALVQDGTSNGLNSNGFHIIDDTVAVSQWATDINEAGRVVGHSGTSASRWGWYSDAPGSSSMQPLNLSGWSRLSVHGINADDVMAGYGRTTASPNDDRGFILSPPPGDGDHDGDVDLYDFRGFQGCFAPAGPVSAACARFDVDDDGNVDRDDYAAFEAAFLGPGS